MWKAGSFWSLCLLLLGFCSAAESQPWCPVQISRAGYASTGPYPGILFSNSGASTYDPTSSGSGGTGVIVGAANTAAAAGFQFFGNSKCVGNTGGSTPHCGSGNPGFGAGTEDDLTAEDQLCPDPIKHTLKFTIWFNFSGGDYQSRLDGGAERTVCTLGKADLHGHCVINSCVAGTVAAAGTYALGLSQTNSVTSSCLVTNGNPCAVDFQAQGGVSKVLVGGQYNYFQPGKYVQTGQLCTTNAGPTPGTVASVPSNSCASGFDLYTNPATGIAQCVSPGTGTPNPGDPSGTGAGGSLFPTSCPSWLALVCSWFAATDSGVESVGAAKGNINDESGGPPSHFSTEAHPGLTGISFFNGVDSRLTLPQGCPENPDVEIMGHHFAIPFNKVCVVGAMVHPVAGMMSVLLAIGIALTGKTSS